jgi:MEDS: MEthanogen/methylotroph, DcmR Sensory domain
LILYSDLANFEYLYQNYIKRSLESLNEIILISTHYYPVTNIIDSLRNTGVDIDKYKKEGLIVVVESKKAYYSLSQEFVGIMIMTKMLLRRADKLGKTGVTIISDMGLFLHTNRIDDLIKCERGLLSSIRDMKVKVLCCYNRSDFEVFIEYQMQQNLLKTHNKVLLFPP